MDRLREWRWLQRPQVSSWASTESKVTFVALQQDEDDHLLKGYMLKCDSESGFWNLEGTPRTFTEFYVKNESSGCARSELALPSDLFERTEIMDFRYNVYCTAISWLKSICRYQTREDELASSSQRLLRLAADRNVPEALALISRYQTSLNLPLVVREPCDGSIVRNMPPTSVAKLQVDQALSAVAGAKPAESWLPRDVVVTIKPSKIFGNSIFRLHLTTEIERLTADYVFSTESMSDGVPSEPSCVFRHIMPTAQRVALVIQLGVKQEHGVDILAAGFANISATLDPQIGDGGSQKLKVKLFTLKEKNRRKMRQLFKDLISGAASDLRLYHERPVDVDLTACKSGNTPQGLIVVRSLLSDSVNVLGGEFVFVQYGMLCLKRFLGSLDLSANDTLWARVRGTEEHASAITGEDVEISAVLPVTESHTVELLSGQNVLATGVVKHKTGKSNVSLFALNVIGKGSKVGSLEVSCVVVSLNVIPDELGTIFSQGSRKLEKVLGFFSPSAANANLWFENLAKRFVELISENADPGISHAAMTALVKLFEWGSRKEKEYLFQPRAASDAPFVKSLISSMKRAIDELWYRNIEGLLRLFPFIGNLMRRYLPIVEHSTSLTALTSSLKAFFQLPTDVVTRRLQALCLDGLESLYLGQRIGTTPGVASFEVTSDLVSQLVSIMNCVVPVHDVAVAFYSLIARTLFLTSNEARLATLLRYQAHNWIVPFWRSRSRTVSEIRAVSAVLSLIPYREQFGPGIASLILALLPTQATKLGALFPDVCRLQIVDLQTQPAQNTFEAAVELCVLFDHSKRAELDAEALLSLAKAIIGLSIPAVWISLNDLLSRKALNLLESASILITDEKSSDSAMPTLKDQERLSVDIITAALKLMGHQRTQDYEDILTRFVQDRPQGSIFSSTVGLISTAWDRLGFEGKAILDKSVESYAQLFLIGSAGGKDTTNARELTVRILKERMTAHWVVMEGNLVSFGELLILAFDYLCLSVPTQELDIGPLFLQLRATLTSDSPIVYKRTLENVERALRCRVAMQSFPQSLLPRQEYLSGLRKAGFLNLYRSCLESIISDCSHDARGRGIALYQLGASHAWNKLNMLPPSPTLMMPLQSEYDRRFALASQGAQVLEEQGYTLEAVIIRQQLIDHFASAEEHHLLATEAHRLADLCDHLASSAANGAKRHFYLVEFKSDAIGMGFLTGRSYIYRGERKHLGNVLDILALEFQCIGQSSLSSAQPTSDTFMVSEVQAVFSERSPDYPGESLPPTTFSRDKPIISPNDSSSSHSHGEGISRLFYTVSASLTLSRFMHVSSVREDRILALQIAIEDLNSKAEQLSHSLDIGDLRHLELVLTGAIHAPLNGGIKWYGMYKDDTGFQECFTSFKASVEKALRYYGEHISENLQPQYQFLCAEFDKTFVL